MHERLFNVLNSSCTAFIFVVLTVSFSANVALSQEAPDARYVFEEDAPDYQDRRDKQTETIIKADKPRDSEMDFEAPEVQFDQENRIMTGSGGVLISREGVQLQADKAKANVATKDVLVEGDVVFSWPEGEVVAEKGEMNLDTEVGTFSDASIEVEQRNFKISAEDLHKDSEVDYRFSRADFTTCTCEDGSIPWSIACAKAYIEDDGYAHTYNTTFDVHGIPVFYAPYFIVPVKRTRQSGLLAPTFGYNSRDGFQFQQPIYGVIDDYSDFTLTPFVASKTRKGASLGYRKVFSRKSNLEGRAYYSDESARDGDLRGTNIDFLYDPEFDEERTAGFVRQSWQSDPSAAVPTSLTSDIRYVSDDLFLRELEDADIGDRSDRFVTSQMLLQSAVGGRLFIEASGEYNQALQIDDDLVFQRLPEVRLSTRESFRPFGFNPYGFKVITELQGTATDFVRSTGFDGWRYDVNPTVRMPHHFRNYVSADLELTMNQTFYQQSNDVIVDSNSDEIGRIEGDERRVFQFAYTTSTAVERVYGVEPDSWLRYLTSLGTRSQAASLQRVKHVIEPFTQFRYTPSTSQDDLPLYDSLDRIRQRSLMRYGVRTSILGKFTPTGSSQEIPELTPSLDDLPVFDPTMNAFNGRTPAFSRSTRSSVREIAFMSLSQVYDFVEDRKDIDPSRGALSDLGIELGVSPTSYFSYSFQSNLDTEEQDFSSWGMAAHFRDDRGDLLRARYSYVEQSVSQLDANLEVVLTDRLKLGFFGRYDDLQSEFIESEIALRIQSACNCWYVDVGYTDTINPDRQQALFRFTLLGLGDLVQNFSLDQQRTVTQ